ncbi:MAG: hypothetical protein AAF456_08305 [Planctomycetota bacterium]
MAQIIDLGNGFAVVDRSGRAEFSDEQVVGLSYYSTRKHSQGVLKWSKRFFHIWVQGQEKPVRLEDKIAAGEPDPFHGMIERISENYRQRASDALEMGAVVSGEGFALDNQILTIAPEKNPHSVPLNEITSMGIFDDELRVWRQGQDEAALSLPLSARNCYPLELLLKTRISEPTAEPHSAGGLGRVLFERKMARGWVITLWVFAASSLIAGILIGIGEPWLIPGGLILAALFAISAWSGSRSVFRCHERGVYKRSLLGERELRYDELTSFSYGATRHYHNGVYTGTHLTLKFIPPTDSGRKSLFYSTTTKHGDAELDNMRDHISGVIASKMAEMLTNNQPVQWTKNLRFAPDGIEYRPAGFLGRKDAVLLPFDQIHGFDIQQGFFMIWEHGKKKPVISEAISEDNFFPGYFVLLSLAQE